MKPFTSLTGVAAALPLENVDTDKILPARYLKTISRDGLRDGLFAVLREDPDFVLNRAPWDHSNILIALDNFGCGSSREHAPWALSDFGIRCLIAPSFADIFFNNCFKNGILPIALLEGDVDRLMKLAGTEETAMMSVDLHAQTITAGERNFAFDVDGKRKQDLLTGVDEIGASLAFAEAITTFEKARDNSGYTLPHIRIAL